MQVIAAAFYRFLQNGNTWMGQRLSSDSTVVCLGNRLSPSDAQKQTVGISGADLQIQAVRI